MSRLIGRREFAGLALATAFAGPALAQTAKPDLQNTLYLDTTYGRVVIQLRPDLAPNHVARLKQLSQEGFYNNVPFHRVIDGFMAQTGDGQYGNGTGGSKYPNLKAEFTQTPFVRGTIGMARSSSPDSANSQFFICFAPSSFLNGQYTVVGQVVSGMEFVDKLKKGPKEANGAVPNPDRIVKMQVAADAK
ncbi:peptidyl-prolyl cis-trans isomerase [Azorhizobium oxalatiphilum]|uniref:Peptidyl-prolyl cis-trans isomerase n=1 Tax=Azorhizobium oxalatiphilum TaxID=980631 RepID=A0A917FAH6_9HYPH|nr:peptidylprolyl isomerase [Azorhizobium oxalatiphilum]GGF60449.1 peptidyl-prolyl cis-trans isomerase [Azorhizobium oxalatiphilum]